MLNKSNGRVLIIAGSDSGGGAGIQADIKTVTALGGYAMTAITALTAQNTLGVDAIFDVDADFVGRQMQCVLSDLGADCIKIGMLNKPDVVDVVTDVLEKQAPTIPLVLDPVMIAKGGASLLTAKAIDHLIQKLVPLAHVMTPNIPEAEILAGMEWDEKADEGGFKIAEQLLTLGPDAVLLKGGHLHGPEVKDRLFLKTGEMTEYSSPRFDTVNTHGTGCTLASAIACGIAQGLDLEAAVSRARQYVIEAIRTAPGYGHGHGPLNHGHTVAEMKTPD